MAANLDLFRMHLHGQSNANTKLDFGLPLSTAIKLYMGEYNDKIISQATLT